MTVSIANKSLTYIFPSRIIDGQAYGLNKGMVGVGSDQSRGVFDNIAVQVLPPQFTLDNDETFNDGVANLFQGPTSGAVWTASATTGRYTATAPAGSVSLATMDLGVKLDASSYIELTGTLRLTTAGAVGGLVFDYYAANDFKFVALDPSGSRIIVGHWEPRRGYVVDQAITKTLALNTDYVLLVSLKGASVAVTLNGTYITTWGYNGAVVDGRTGVFTQNGTVSFDAVRFRTNDPVFAPSSAALTLNATSAPPPPGSVTPLSEQSLNAMVAEVVASMSSDLSLPNRDRLTGLHVTIVDLAGATLAQTFDHTIYVDINAAGYGWSTNGLTTTGLVDLRTALKHELGHVLGLTHDDTGQYPWMAATMSPMVKPGGTRT